MKKILPIILVGFIILSGFGAEIVRNIDSRNVL